MDEIRGGARDSAHHRGTEGRRDEGEPPPHARHPDPADHVIDGATAVIRDDGVNIDGRYQAFAERLQVGFDPSSVRWIELPDMQDAHAADQSGSRNTRPCSLSASR